MKKNLFQFVAAVLLAISVVSCEKNEKDYQQVIPENVTGVLAIKAKQLAEKADMSEETKTQLINMLKGGLKANNTEKLERIFKNPEEAGISMSEPILIFGAMENKQIGLVAKVKKQSKLNDLFVVLQSEGVGTVPVKKGGYSEVMIENMVCTYNDHSLLLLFANNNPADAQQQAASYMSQEKEQSIVSNKIFQKTISAGSDISSFMLLSESQEFINKLNIKNMMTASSFNLPDSATYSKMCILMSLNFEKGSIQIKTDYDSNDKEALKKYEEYCASLSRKQNDIFLNRFPASTLFYTGWNMNGEKIYEFVAPSLKALPFSPESVNMEKLFSSIDGNFSLGITNVGAMGIPSILAYADVKDNDFLTSILEQLSNNKVPLVPNGENAWKINIPMMNVNMYLGVKNNQFYFTNDADKYAQIDQPAANPLGKSPQGSNLKDSYSCFYINISQIMQIPMLDMIFQRIGSQGMIAKNALNGCDYLEMLTPTLTNLVFNFYLKDKNQNSLKVITNEAEQLLPMFSVQY